MERKQLFLNDRFKLAADTIWKLRHEGTKILYCDVDQCLGVFVAVIFG